MPQILQKSLLLSTNLESWLGWQSFLQAWLCYNIQLTFEQHGLELSRSIYTHFFPINTTVLLYCATCSWLNPWIQKRRCRGLTVKLHVDFQLYRGGCPKPPRFSRANYTDDKLLCSLPQTSSQEDSIHLLKLLTLKGHKVSNEKLSCSNSGSIFRAHDLRTRVTLGFVYSLWHPECPQI